MMMSITKVEVVMMIMELSNQCLGNLLTAAIRDTLATRTITPSLQQQQQQRKFSEMINHFNRQPRIQFGEAVFLDQEAFCDQIKTQCGIKSTF